MHRTGAPLRSAFLSPVLALACTLAGPVSESAASARVRGVVTDARGAPVAGASVAWGRSGTGEAARSAADGSFVLPPVPRGGRAVCVEAPGFLPREIVLPDGAGVVRIALRERPSIRGRVLDRRSLSPIEGASLTLRGPSGSAVAARRTGADGAFAFEGLDAADYRLEASAGGYASEVLSPASPEDGSRADILLRRAATLRGRVEDDSGQPLAGAAVTVSPLDRRPGAPEMRAETTSAADGSFAAGPVPEGVPLVALASLPDGRRGFALPADATDSPVLTLRAGARLRACGALANSGEAVRGFRLTAGTREGARRRVAEMAGMPEGAASPEGGACASLALLPGSYRIVAEADGAAPSGAIEVRLGPGESRDLGTIPFEEHATIELRAVRRDGSAVEGALAIAYAREGGRAKRSEARTDRTGRARLEGLPRGSYDVEVVAESARPHWEENVPAPGPERTVRLSEGGTVRGQVLDARTGAPVPSFRLRVVPLSPDRLRPDMRLLRVYREKAGPVRDGEGRFALEGLPEGRFAVRVEARGYAAASVSFDAAAGRDAEILVELPPGSCATGLVLDARSRAPVAGAAVRDAASPFGIPGETGPEIAATDGEGRFEVCELQEGASRRVVVDHADYAPAPMEIRAGDGATAILDEGASLEGRLVGSDGRGIAGWSVEARGSGWVRCGETREHGEFRFDRLAPGEVRVVLTDPLGDEYGDREEGRKVLEAGRTAEIEIVLPGILSGLLTQGGAPLTGVAVRSIHLPREGANPDAWSLRRSRTGADGTFALARVREGTHILQAILEDQLVNRIVQVGPDGAEVRIEAGSLEVSGIAVDGDRGTALAAARVRTGIGTPGRGLSQFAYFLPSRDGAFEIEGYSEDVNVARTGTDGRFRLFADPAATGVVLSHPEFLPAEAPLERFVPRQVPTLPLFRGGSVTVRLLAPGGTAPCVGEVALVALEDSPSSALTRTDPLGQARYEAVRQGTYAVWGICDGIGAPTRLDAAVEVKPGEDEEESLATGWGGTLVVDLPDDGSPLEEKLVLSGDAGAYAQSLLLRLLRGAPREVVEGGLLRVTLDRFPAGTFTLEEGAGGGRSFRIAEGERVAIRLGPD